MTMLASILPKLAALGQPAVLAAGVATGVGVGAIGVATGAIPVADPAPRNVSLYECPGSGRVMTSIEPNQNVLVTARSADGQWLQIYVGEAGVDRGWAPASALELKAAPDGLPIEDCTPEATDAPLPTTLEPPSNAPSAGPSAGVSATPAGPSAVPVTLPPGATPTPAPTPTKTPTPTPTPGPTPTPMLGPAITDINIYQPPQDPGGNYIIFPPGCTGEFTGLGLTINVNDPDGIESVELFYQPASGASLSSVFMQYEEDDPLLNGKYDGQFESNGTWGPGIVTWYIEAWDNANHLTRVYPSQDVELQYCSD